MLKCELFPSTAVGRENHTLDLLRLDVNKQDYLLRSNRVPDDSMPNHVCILDDVSRIGHCSGFNASGTILLHHLRCLVQGSGKSLFCLLDLAKMKNLMLRFIRIS